VAWCAIFFVKPVTDGCDHGRDNGKNDNDFQDIGLFFHNGLMVLFIRCTACRPGSA
jgi:hypothetical protein